MKKDILNNCNTLMKSLTFVRDDENLSRYATRFSNGWGTGIRTPILGFKGPCPTIRRSPNRRSYNIFGTIEENMFRNKKLIRGLQIAVITIVALSTILSTGAFLFF